MAFNLTNINNIPAEVILNIFSMFINIKDVIKFAKCNNYVFNIYKNNLDKIVNKLINNNETNSFVNYVIIGCFDKTDSIDKKLKNIELIADFVSKTTNEEQNNQYEKVNDDNNELWRWNEDYRIDINTRMIKYYYFRVICNFPHEFSKDASSYPTTVIDNEKMKLMHQVANRGIELENAFYYVARDIRDISQDKIEKFFELIGKNIEAHNAIRIINDFNEMQINKLEKVILYGFNQNDAVDIAEKFDDDEIELILQIVSINNSQQLLSDVIEVGREEMIIIIKLLKNNFDIENIVHTAFLLRRMANFNDNYIIKCIELKSKGISESNILDLLEEDRFENFDSEYYDNLIKQINDIDIVNAIIYDETDDEDINKMIELINEGICKKYVFYLTETSYSKEEVLILKPYLEYIDRTDDIEEFMINYDEIKDYIKMFQDNNLNDKHITNYLINKQYMFPKFNVLFVSKLIRVIKELQQYQLDDDFIIDFIHNFTYKCQDLNYNSTFDLDEPPSKRQMINMETIYELPHFNACIRLINRGFRNNNKLVHIIMIMVKNNIDTKYIENLNEADIDFIKTFIDEKLIVFFNLCKETNNIDHILDLMKKLDVVNIIHIYNFAYNTGNSYSYSLKNYEEQSCTVKCLI